MHHAIQCWPDKNWRKRVYNAHNKAQEGESSMRRSTRVRNKVCGFKNDQNNDCKGKQRRMTKKYFGNNE